MKFLKKMLGSSFELPGIIVRKILDKISSRIFPAIPRICLGFSHPCSPGAGGGVGHWKRSQLIHCDGIASSKGHQQWLLPSASARRRSEGAPPPQRRGVSVLSNSLCQKFDSVALQFSAPPEFVRSGLFDRLKEFHPQLRPQNYPPPPYRVSAKSQN